MSDASYSQIDDLQRAFIDADDASRLVLLSNGSAIYAQDQACVAAALETLARSVLAHGAAMPQVRAAE